VARVRVSVVVIARNEEARIGRALESVFAAVQGLGAEVIFVDSASTDNTVAAAQRFPVRLIGLDPGWPLSPAAGRHAGFHAASGGYVFFLDGDSELEPGFLEAALPLLEARPEVAAVLGQRRELSFEAGRAVVVEEDHYRISQPRLFRPGECIGGSGLYRAAALREVGGFNPWIRSCEEAELCLRLHDAGHKLLFIPQPMISHLDHREPSVGELRRRWRDNLLLGRGQVLRLHPFRRPHYEGLARILEMLGCLVALPLLALAAFAAGSPGLLLAWPAFMAAAYAVFALRSRSAVKPLYYFLHWSLAACKLVEGFARRPRDPAEYPVPTANCSTPGTPQGEADERPAGNHRLLEGLC
jgi:glycosyltransferase involved in cell wall biosynthesis